MPASPAEQPCSARSRAGDRHARATAWALFGFLAAFSLFIGDYSSLSIRLICAALFLAAAVYLILARNQQLRLTLPSVCPLLMALYGAGQTLWSPQKIIYNGLEKTLFWLALALIGLMGSQVFRSARIAERIRQTIAVFGSLQALLSVLEQASHTGEYLWLIPSGFPDVFGTFAYYNNFAQFIELTLPVTLWEGLRHREIRLPYMLLAALQVGAVVSSPSRAGAVLVLAELVIVLFLAWFRRRQSMSIAVLAIALGLSAGFSYIAGFQQVMQKFERHDQLANRRLINRSSVDMIRERPFTGWGLGAYASVYKMFALYDDGTWVNQAHNDYLEWAAEGGIPYACLMLLLMVWSVRPAVRSVWGIGLLAFCLHALVDYPFARLGTCAWYFVLAAMLAVHNGEVPERRRRRSRSVETSDAIAPLVTA
jgi:O-antigen ligase